MDDLVPAARWVCLKMGYIPNEIAIFHRDNDQQNHWVQWGTRHFQTHPDGAHKYLLNLLQGIFFSGLL